MFALAICTFVTLPSFTSQLVCGWVLVDWLIDIVDSSFTYLLNWVNKLAWKPLDYLVFTCFWIFVILDTFDELRTKQCHLQLCYTHPKCIRLSLNFSYVNAWTVCWFSQMRVLKAFDCAFWLKCFLTFLNDLAWVIPWLLVKFSTRLVREDSPLSPSKHSFGLCLLR